MQENNLVAQRFKGDVGSGSERPADPGLEELFCRDVRHLASSKGKDGESGMKEVRSWNVLGLLPGLKIP